MSNKNKCLGIFATVLIFAIAAENMACAWLIVQNKAKKQQTLISDITYLEEQNHHQEQSVKDLQNTIDILNGQISTMRDQLSRYEDRLGRSGERKTKLISLGTYTITAYCSCSKCCGKWAENRPGGIVTGAAGIELVDGVSVASPLPIGTEILIEGHKYIVHDRTAQRIVNRYNGKIIDIYMQNHDKALKFGKKQLAVFEVTHEASMIAGSA